MPTRIEFCTDGWRAIIAEEFTFDNVRLCAQAVADWLHQEGRASAGLVVGYDTRFASDRFAEAVTEVAAANDEYGGGRRAGRPAARRRLTPGVRAPEDRPPRAS